MLLIITTNGERALPPAFLRRCIILELPEARAKSKADGQALTLESVAEAHFPEVDPCFAKEFFSDVANELETLREDARCCTSLATDRTGLAHLPGW